MVHGSAARSSAVGGPGSASTSACSRAAASGCWSSSSQVQVSALAVVSCPASRRVITSSRTSRSDIGSPSSSLAASSMASTDVTGAAGLPALGHHPLHHPVQLGGGGRRGLAAGQRQRAQHPPAQRLAAQVQVDELGGGLGDGVRVPGQVGGEQRPPDDPQRHRGHVRGDVPGGAVGPVAGRRQPGRLLGHHPRVRPDLRVVEGRLDEPALPAVQVAFAGQQPIAQQRPGPLGAAALAGRARQPEEEVADQVGGEHEVVVLALEAEVDDVGRAEALRRDQVRQRGAAEQPHVVHRAQLRARWTAVAFLHRDGHTATLTPRFARPGGCFRPDPDVWTAPVSRSVDPRPPRRNGAGRAGAPGSRRRPRRRSSRRRRRAARGDGAPARPGSGPGPRR